MSIESIDVSATPEEQVRLMQLLRDDLDRARRPVSADDDRVLPLLREMYDTMVNNSSAHLWSNFVDSITGMPDLSTRKYGGVVTLKFYFTDVEVPGDIADWEIENAILDSISGDLCHGYEDEVEVDYEEE